MDIKKNIPQVGDTIRITQMGYHHIGEILSNDKMKINIRVHKVEIIRDEDSDNFIHLNFKKEDIYDFTACFPEDYEFMKNSKDQWVCPLPADYSEQEECYSS